jgi:hypothetical protein
VIIIKVRNPDKTYTVDAGRNEEQTYEVLVAEWQDRNNRGISVNLDESYHPDKSITINCDNIVQIIRK